MEFSGFVRGELLDLTDKIFENNGYYVYKEDGHVFIAFKLPCLPNCFQCYAVYLYDEYDSENTEKEISFIKQKKQRSYKIFSRNNGCC